MSRTSKGARLVWRDESRKADGSLRNKAGWFIRDGQSFLSACGGTGDRERAEKELAKHITEKYRPARERGRDPNQVDVADVINVYMQDVVPTHAAPAEAASRLVAILGFFGRDKLSDVNGQRCRDYVDQHRWKSAARRQLEDFRAAINHYCTEGYVTTAPKITLPKKPTARHRWLTRQEAAKLLLAAWRMRQTWKGEESDRRTGRHVARFMLTGLYTGTRSGAVCGAAVRPTEGRGFVDLDRGIFFRRAQDAVETKKRQPAVRLPDRLVAHMRRWAATPLEMKTKGRSKSELIGRMIAQDYVVEWNGKPVLSVKKAFRSAVEAAGLGWYEMTTGKDGKPRRVFKTDVTPHTLRHTAATWLMQNGTELSLAASYLGMTEQVLRDTYWHHHPDFQAKAAALITAKSPELRVKSNVVRMS